MQILKVQKQHRPKQNEAEAELGKDPKKGGAPKQIGKIHLQLDEAGSCRILCLTGQKYLYSV